ERCLSSIWPINKENNIRCLNDFHIRQAIRMFHRIRSWEVKSDLASNIDIAKSIGWGLYFHLL
ncbi:hypothetical protein UP25_00055, partial [Vibrio parahaemolyticus]